MARDTRRVSEREQRVLGHHRDRRARGGRSSRRAHHDGPRRRRQGHADADRGPAGAGLRLARRSPSSATSRRSRPAARGLAFTTDSFVVKPIRFPGGSIGELAVNGTVNDLAVGRRAAARPQPRDGARGGALDRRAARGGRGDRRRGARRPASRSSPATRRSSSAATRTRCTCARRDRPASTSAPRSRRPRLRPGDRILVSGSIGDHGTAIMLARGEFDLDADVESDTRSLWPAVDALLGAAGPRLRCMRDATRGGVASVLNELARASEAAIVVREARHPGAAGRGRGGGDPRARPDVHRQRGHARGLRRAGAGGRRAGCAARRRRAARAPSRSARCTSCRPGWCWWRPRSAASA